MGRSLKETSGLKVEMQETVLIRNQKPAAVGEAEQSECHRFKVNGSLVSSCTGERIPMRTMCPDG